MLKKNFQKKFGLKSLSICLLSVGIIILIAQRLQMNAEQEIVREVNVNQLMIIQEIASDLRSLMQDLQSKTIIWTKLHQLDLMEGPEILHELQTFYELTQNEISHIGIINTEGHYEYVYPPVSHWEKKRKDTFSRTDFFQNALIQAKKTPHRRIPYISNQYNLEISPGSIPISLPLYTNQKIEGELKQSNHLWGVLVVFVDLAVINNICQNHYYHLHDYFSFWLIDDQGNFLSHEKKAWIGKNIFHFINKQVPEGGLPHFGKIVQQKLLKGHSGTDIYVDNFQEKYYLNYTPVQFSGKQWSMAVITPESKMDYWEKRVLKSAWQWWLSIISFILIILSFLQVIIIFIHKKRIDWEKEQKEKFQEAFDGITDLVYMIDDDYNLRIVNKAFRNLCGKPEKEFEGTKCFQFIRERENPCPDCPIPKTKSTKESQQLEQIIFEETVHLYAYPLINQEGETSALVVFARIITKEKILEQKLHHRERLSLLGELAACIVHEIKNPMVGIGMLTQLVRDSCLEKKPALKDIDKIIKECKRLEQLIENLARFSRPAPLCFDKEDIHIPLDLSLALLQKKLEKNNIQLQTDYQKDIPPVIHDPQKMQQVFLNLILNAIKAMPEGGKLNIRTGLQDIPSGNGRNGNGSNGRLQSKKQMICIDIQDEGIGIPKAAQEEIFKPFFSNSSKGTGLGLFIVRGIIQQHRGLINLKSRIGHGTIFTICLPIQ